MPLRQSPLALTGSVPLNKPFVPGTLRDRVAYVLAQPSGIRIRS